MPIPPPITATTNIRRLDPRRDLEVVADLIEEAFQLKNDPDGQIILRQMRSYAQRQRFESNLLLLPGAPDGFVWVEDGQIVGNISLIPYFTNFKRKFLIANVAVTPDHRQKGIATALTRQALRFTHQWPDSEIWLQVRSENQSAIHLYQGQGFRFIHAITQWKHPSSGRYFSPEPPNHLEGLKITDRVISDWSAQSVWLDLNYPKETRWYLDVEFQDFSPWSWLNPTRWSGLSKLHHLTLREKEKPAGVLTWQETNLSADQFWLALPASAQEDQQAQWLLGSFLANKKPARPLTLEYPYGRAMEGLEQAGFVISRHLNWMKYFHSSK
ncbi:MAG: GNAT family N-acetyltransferase [Anaerolineaceae bacterium]